MLRRGGFFPGRLEAVLDRSWEIEPVTWRQLTWWDRLPCGQSLMSQIQQEPEFPLPFPSPAFSMITNPPTPHRKRKMPPTHLSFRSSSPSPIPSRPACHASSAYSSSPLAWPLPPSPESYGSVFLPNSPTDPFFTPTSSSSCYTPTFPPATFGRNCAMSDSMLRRATTLLPTPPDSEERSRKAGQRSLSSRNTVFNFPLPPPQLSPGLLPVPPPLLSRPPPVYR